MFGSRFFSSRTFSSRYWSATGTSGVTFLYRLTLRYAVANPMLNYSTANPLLRYSTANPLLRYWFKRREV